MSPFRIFIGYDERQPISYNVLQYSILRRASKPVSISPLVQSTLPVKREGLTPFTWTRFLVPWLCDFEGWALFLDADMMVRSDIAQLFALADDNYAAMVSKNRMRFEWGSAILFNNAACGMLTPEHIETASGLHGMEWATAVGALPASWNHLVGYDEPRPDADLVHFTQGVPCFPETEDSEYAAEWLSMAQSAMSARPWFELMGNSVHAKPVYERLIRDGKIRPRDAGAQASA